MTSNQINYEIFNYFTKTMTTWWIYSIILSSGLLLHYSAPHCVCSLISSSLCLFGLHNWKIHYKQIDFYLRTIFSCHICWKQLFSFMHIKNKDKGWLVILYNVLFGQNIYSSGLLWRYLKVYMWKKFPLISIRGKWLGPPDVVTESEEPHWHEQELSPSLSNWPNTSWIKT